MSDVKGLEQSQLNVTTLGPARQRSPLNLSSVPGDGRGDFTPDGMRMTLEPRFLEGGSPDALTFEMAGPREHVYFDAAKCKAAIVTCGGLCPGINNVIRAC